MVIVFIGSTSESKPIHMVQQGNRKKYYKLYYISYMWEFYNFIAFIDEDIIYSPTFKLCAHFSAYSFETS